MLEAGLQRDPMAGQQRQLRGAAGEAFERGEAVLGGELADRVHPGVEIERRKRGPPARISATRCPTWVLDGSTSGSVAMPSPPVEAQSDAKGVNGSLRSGCVG